MEPLHITIFQSRCQYKAEICLFSNFLSLIYHLFFSYIQKKNKKPFYSYFYFSSFLFINNVLFVSQERSYEKLIAILYSSYNIISSLFNQFGLVIGHNKLEVFYFSKTTEKTNHSLLDLKLASGAELKPKDIQCYLGFFFNKKLSF